MKLPIENKITEPYILQLEQVLGARYVKDNEEGNLCFANNNAELRDDFKQVFTLKDITNYLWGQKKEAVGLPLPLPKNATEFWEKADQGCKNRQKDGRT